MRNPQRLRWTLMPRGQSQTGGQIHTLPRFFPQLLNTVEILGKSWQQVGTTRSMTSDVKMEMSLFELRERPGCINKKYKDNLLFSLPDLYFSIPGSNLEQQIANYKDMFSPLFLASTRWQVA